MAIKPNTSAWAWQIPALWQIIDYEKTSTPQVCIQLLKPLKVVIYGNTLMNHTLLHYATMILKEVKCYRLLNIFKSFSMPCANLRHRRDVVHLNVVNFLIVFHVFMKITCLLLCGSLCEIVNAIPPGVTSSVKFQRSTVVQAQLCY